MRDGRFDLLSRMGRSCCSLATVDLLAPRACASHARGVFDTSLPWSQIRLKFALLAPRSGRTLPSWVAHHLGFRARLGAVCATGNFGALSPSWRSLPSKVKVMQKVVGHVIFGECDAQAPSTRRGIGETWGCGRLSLVRRRLFL